MSINTIPAQVSSKNARCFRIGLKSKHLSGWYSRPHETAIPPKVGTNIEKDIIVFQTPN